MLCHLPVHRRLKLLEFIKISTLKQGPVFFSFFFSSILVIVYYRTLLIIAVQEQRTLYKMIIMTANLLYDH